MLRDVLSLRGTKYGCGVGACGACTVHVKTGDGPDVPHGRPALISYGATPRGY